MSKFDFNLDNVAPTAKPTGVPIPFVEFKNINQRYGDFVLFDNLSFTMEDTEREGEIIAIMGESGCGKSSILRMVAGIQQAQSGEVRINNVIQKPSDKIPMVFQKYTNLEYMSVLDNITLKLRWSGVPKKERDEKGMEMVKILGLKGHEHKYAQYPRLSGGQLQRVAIGRSLIFKPDMLLMDEPFGALDIATRFDMYDLMFNLRNTVKPKIIFVTHNSTEAVYLADKIYVMSACPGRISEIIDLDLPDVRTPDLMYEPKFINYKKKVDNLIKLL